MKILLSLVLFFSSCIAHSGGGQRVYLDSNEFDGGDSIIVGIDPFVSPCLLFVDNPDGERSFVEVSNETVTLYIVALTFEPCPGTGSSAREEFDLGAIEPGDYTLRVELVGFNVTFPIAPGITPLFLGSLDFSVRGGQSVAVDTMATWSILFLMGLVFAMALLNVQKLKKVMLTSILLIISISSLADPKVFHILLDHGEEVPSPEAIVHLLHHLVVIY